MHPSQLGAPAVLFRCQCSRCLIEGSSIGEPLVQASAELDTLVQRVLLPNKSITHSIRAAGGPGALQVLLFILY